MAALYALKTQYKIHRLKDTSETDSERLKRVQDLHARFHAWLLGIKDSNATVLTEPSSLVAINSGVSLNTRDGISAPTGPSVQDWPASKDGVPRCSHHNFSPMPVYHYLDACPDKEGRYHARTLRESQVVILRQTGDQSGTGKQWPAFQDGVPLCLYHPGRSVPHYHHFETCPSPDAKLARQHADYQRQQQIFAWRSSVPGNGRGVYDRGDSCGGSPGGGNHGGSPGR